ncbi:MAG: hypothetical protein A2603_14525 [Bdellovibrionales bacterium RIFOXYD1_FULL_55_31]|nr:MAG: hypothetical protein A2603_14525 [Bdellovibrionales bacterium RIFOXYD1_FULL_55_31]
MLKSKWAVMAGAMVLTIASTPSFADLNVPDNFQNWLGKYVVGDCGADFVGMEKDDTVDVTLETAFEDGKTGEDVYRLTVRNAGTRQISESLYIPESGKQRGHYRNKGDWGCESSTSVNTFDGLTIVNQITGRFYYLCLFPTKSEVIRSEAKFEIGKIELRRSYKSNDGEFTCSLNKIES